MVDDTTVLPFSQDFVTFFNGCPLPFVVTEEFSIIYCNQSSLELFGWVDEDSLVGQPFKSLLPNHDEYVKIRVSIYASLEMKGHIRFEYQLAKHDGSSVFCLILGKKLSDNPEIIYFTFVDITDRTESEKLLRESEQRYKALVDEIPIGVAVHKEGKLLFGNKATGRIMLGIEKPEDAESDISMKDLMGSQMIEYVHPEFRDVSVRRTLQVMTERVALPPIEGKWIRPSTGDVIDVESRLIPVDYLGEPAVMVAFRDITEEKLVKTRLRELNNCILSFTSDPIQNINKLIQVSGVLLEGECAFYQEMTRDRYTIRGSWNAISGLKLSGSSLGKVCYDVWNLSSDEVYVVSNLQSSRYAKTDKLVQLLKAESYMGKVIRVGTESIGVLCVIFTQVKDFNDNDKSLLGAIASAISIEETRYIAEKNLRSSEERYRLLIDSSPYSIGIVSQSGKILYANESTVTAFRVSSIDDLVGSPVFNLVSVEDRKRVRSDVRSLKNQTSLKYNLIKLKRPVSGEEFPAEVYISFIDYEGDRAFQVIAVDTTDRLRLEEQQLIASKAEAVSILAGGIAHDLKNYLSPILTSTSMILETKKPGDIFTVTDMSLLKNAEAAGIKATELSKRLLQTSRKQPMTYGPVDINSLVHEIVSMYSMVLVPTIKVHTTFDKSIPSSIYLDASQIEQAILNLTLNAKDAMLNGGELIIKTELVDIDDEYSARLKFSRPGNFVKITVTDTGSGIDPKIIGKIYDPFFSTKDQRQGSGLGLATTLGVVKNHGGWMNVYSELGEGTTFSIYLPVGIPPGTEPLKVAPTVSIPTDLTGTEVILLVDDSDPILEAGKSILTNLGYTVLTASDGTDALNLVRGSQEIDLIVTDMIMPIKGGRELLEEIRLEGLFQGPVLLMSGYDVARRYTEGEHGFADFIEKPFQANKLAVVVRTVLNSYKKSLSMQATVMPSEV